MSTFGLVGNAHGLLRGDPGNDSRQNNIYFWLVRTEGCLVASKQYQRQINLIKIIYLHIILQEAKISKQMDYNIYFKCENLQYTGRYLLKFLWIRKSTKSRVLKMIRIMLILFLKYQSQVPIPKIQSHRTKILVVKNMLKISQFYLH